MNEQDRRVADLLARYVAEERPPSEVDARIRTVLRGEGACRRSHHRWLGVSIALAASILLLWMRPRLSLNLLVGRDDSTAVHSVRPEDGDVTTHRGTPSRDRGVDDTDDTNDARLLSYSFADAMSDTDSDPGVQALRTAGRLLQEGEFRAALERLEPCPRTIGTDDLLEECEFLVTRALCGAGELVGGRRRIITFRQRWPRSIHEPELSELCHDPPNDPAPGPRHTPPHHDELRGRHPAG